MLEPAVGLVCFVAGFLLLRRGGSEWASEGGAGFVGKYLAEPGKAFCVATLATGMLHSSSAFLTLLVALAGSGRIPTIAALAAIIGANVGTTATALLVSLPTPKNLLLILGLGSLAASCFSRGALWLVFGAGRCAGGRSSLQTGGQLLLGLGLVLVGLERVAPVGLASWAPLASLLMAAQSSPLVGVITGIWVAVLLQSSTLLVGMLMGLVTAGSLGLPGAIAVIVGANVGTTADVLLAAVGAGRPARRVALGHLLLNCAGAALFLLFPGVLLQLVQGASLQRSVALSHTFFNIAGLFFWPLLPSLARLLEILVPDGKER